MICINAKADFKGFVEKIYSHPRINQNRSNVHIFMDNKVSLIGKPYEIRDDIIIECTMLVVEKKTIDTILCYKESY